MQAIKAIAHQGICDLTIQQYGTVDALAEMLADNINSDYVLDAVLVLGSSWKYDPESSLTNKKILKTLNGKTIRTYRVINQAGDGLLTESGFTILNENGQTIIP